MTIGETLKRARKKMNLDLDQVAESTKIAKMFLIALENDDISSLPSGVYARNFLRAYARFLKLDEDIITAEYHEQFNVTPHFVAHQEQTKLDDMAFRRQRLKLQLFMFVLIIVLGLVGFYLWTLYKGKQGFGATPVASTSAPALETNPVPFQDGGPVEDYTPPEPSITSDDAPASNESTVDDSPEVESDLGSATEDPTTAPVEDNASSEEEGSSEPQGARLPLSDLSSVVWTPADRPATSMEDLFAIESLDAVWVEVSIDGEELTNRILKRGEVRYYKYGSLNTIVIGDTSKVAIQDGSTFRNQLDERNLSPKLRDFPAGDLLTAYEAWLLEHGPGEQNREQ